MDSMLISRELVYSSPSIRPCFVQSTLMDTAIVSMPKDQSRKLNSRSTITNTRRHGRVAFSASAGCSPKDQSQATMCREGRRWQASLIGYQCYTFLRLYNPALHDLLGPSLEHPPHLPDFRQVDDLQVAVQPRH